MKDVGRLGRGVPRSETCAFSLCSVTFSSSQLSQPPPWRCAPPPRPPWPLPWPPQLQLAPPGSATGVPGPPAPRPSFPAASASSGGPLRAASRAPPCEGVRASPARAPCLLSRLSLRVSSGAAASSPAAGLAAALLGAFGLATSIRPSVAEATRGFSSSATTALPPPTPAAAAAAASSSSSSSSDSSSSPSCPKQLVSAGSVLVSPALRASRFLRATSSSAGAAARQLRAEAFGSDSRAPSAERLRLCADDARRRRVDDADS